MQALLKRLLRAATRVLFRVTIRGESNVAASRLLIIANHESLLDGLLLGLFLPQNPVFVVHTEVVGNPLFRLVLFFCDYLSVDPTSPLAMKRVIRLLEGGRPVVIFPEGRITITGSLMKTYDGPAFVAAKTAATVLPVRIEGAARSYFSRVRGRAPRRLFPRITLTFTAPTEIRMPSEGPARERRRKAGDAMRRVMQTMIFTSRPQHSLFDALLSAMSLYGRQWRLVEDIKQTEYSYNDLLKMAFGLGRLISRLTQPEEKVGILLPNVAPTMGLLFGLNAFGRVPAMMNYTAGSEGMQSACKAACVRTIVTSHGFVEQAKLAEKVSALEGVSIQYLEDLRANLGFWDKLWILWATRFPYVARKAVSPENPAVVLFTSGSEGQPKGVVLSHRALLANVSQIRSVIPFSVDDKILNALPLFHSFGLTAGGLLPLLNGASVFLYPSPLHYRIIPELAYDRNCTVLLGTSTFLGNYARFAHPYDFHYVRYVIAGAEKLADTVRSTWFEKFGVRIFEGYGATETSPVLSVNTPMAYRTGTVGQLLPGVAAEIRAVPGIDRGGVLHVSGPNVMSGYLRVEKPGVLEAPSSEAGPGWYNTGDIVEMDADGFVRVVGRVKRFAKVAGEMISLEVVEKIARSASPDKAHAASSQEDPSRGENVVLFTTDANLSREALQAAAKAAGLPEIAVPRKVIFLLELPVLGTGKTDYVTLKQQARHA